MAAVRASVAFEATLETEAESARSSGACNRCETNAVTKGRVCLAAAMKLLTNTKHGWRYNA